MKIKMIGLGKMGMNLALNMLEHHIGVQGFDVNLEVKERAKQYGIKVYGCLEEAISTSEKNIFWVMLPAGEITNNTLLRLGELCNEGDIIIDRGNSDYRHTRMTANIIKQKGVYFFDIGTSGGVYGARHGANFMCGGDQLIFDQFLKNMLIAIAAKDGCLYTGKVGSGHYLKMVHNAMLYGYMQTLGEGFELLEKSEFDYNLKSVAESLSKSSVIRGWLLELCASAFAKDEHLDNIKGIINSSKTTVWTVETACELGVPIPVIASSLMMRLQSKQNNSFSARVIASLRDEVGGHKAQTK